MKIQQLRKKIDKIDKKLLNLFEKRMKISLKIANYKISTAKKIVDFKRENDILKTVKKRSTQKFTHSNSFIFSTIINVSKFFQYRKIKTLPKNIINISMEKIINTPEENINKISPPRLGCLETNDNYSQIATARAFPYSTINNYTFISDLFDALDQHIIDFGVIELNNPYQQSINNIYDIINENNTYIHKILNLNASYCLAVNPKNKNDFQKIISTKQILSQCSKYIKKYQYEKSTLDLIFESAFLISKLDEPLAVICPKETALKYNLNIMEENVQDHIENNRKFIVISKNVYTTQNQNILSLAIEINDTTKFLSNISTYFNINNIKPINLQIKPLKNKNNNATVYLDILGNINDKPIISFINYIRHESNSFQLLGCYSEENI